MFSEIPKIMKEKISLKKVAYQLIAGTAAGLVLLILALILEGWLDWNPFFIYHSNTPLVVIGVLAAFLAILLLWLKFRSIPISKLNHILGLLCIILIIFGFFFMNISSAFRAISYRVADKPFTITAKVEYIKMRSKSSKVIFKTPDNKLITVKWNNMSLGLTKNDRFYKDMQGLKPIQDLSVDDTVRLEGRVGCFGFAIDRIIITSN